MQDTVMVSVGASFSHTRLNPPTPTHCCREKNREEKKRDREEDEEEAYERRKLERKLREKEAAYQEVSVHCKVPRRCHQCPQTVINAATSVGSLKRLKNWEIRERKKARDYAKELEREEERRREMVTVNNP